MKRKLSIMWLKFNIRRCKVLLKFWDLFHQIIKIILNPKVYSIIMKFGGACCVWSGIATMFRGYANPISAGIAYLFVGWILIASKSTFNKEDI